MARACACDVPDVASYHHEVSFQRCGRDQRIDGRDRIERADASNGIGNRGVAPSTLGALSVQLLPVDGQIPSSDYHPLPSRDVYDLSCVLLAVPQRPHVHRIIVTASRDDSADVLDHASWA